MKGMPYLLLIYFVSCLSLDPEYNSVMLSVLLEYFSLILFFFFFCVCGLFRAILAGYEGSQARGQIGAVAAGLHHSHRHAESEPHL